MTAQEQQQLARTLWNIADKLRGAMSADDFRDYMLSFLFLRYLSTNYEEAAQKTLGIRFDEINSFVAWAEANKEDINLLETQLKRQLHYLIKPQFLWSNIVSLAKKQDAELLNTLQSGFKFIEEESFQSTFRGLFSEINLTADKLGRNYSERNKLLCEIVEEISNGMPSDMVDNDVLGDAYEYLIGQFAAGSGKKAGEFYTPQEISSVLSGIVTLTCQNNNLQKRKGLENILDFACGSGSLLLNVRKEMGKNIGKIYGQEKNITTYNLARMNMILHGVKDTEFEIFQGDTLKNEWDIFNETNPAKKITFDAIVANPPFSYRWDPDSSASADFRFAEHGLAPKSAADFSFLLHGFHFLGKEGVMAIVLPHGVLFRVGAEERIRQKLLEDNHIDTVIGLPANLFYSTSIPVCILVLKKCRSDENVLFINASEHFEKGKRQNRLSADNIDKIISTYQERKDEARYSRLVSQKEIVENGYNLNITRYISTDKEEKPINLDDIHTQLVDIEKDIEKATKEHNTFLRELGLKELP